MNRLHDLWLEFEEGLRESGITEEQFAALLNRAYRYREEAVAYRLSAVSRTEELKLQLRHCSYRSLRYEWFSELNADEIVEILPYLVPASMHWEAREGDPSGISWLIRYVNAALDALPRDQARELYLEGFKKYLQGFGYYRRATPEERRSMLTDYMWLDRQQIYASATAQENRDALAGLIRLLLGDEAVGVYLAGLDRAGHTRMWSVETA
ncbi:hypothetical protein SAMN00790413_01744 [Deinococcus hopiensis KR-140]|uniref:Uncharacterized protein n=2 Tax=Deinococcus TaxID=1298 RepID=A0A1W1VIH7_9DEIO|nr:hypothetical protein SAMN00790413_01744 [Deinococcus hopiensis KR-140]